MVFRIVACVKEMLVRFHVFVDLVRFDLQEKAVRVCVQQLAPRAVLFFFQVLVKEVVHQDLAVVKDCHPGVDSFFQNQLGLAHVDSGQIV